MRARVLPVVLAGALVIASAGTGAARRPRQETRSYAPTDPNVTVSTPQETPTPGVGDSASQYEFELRPRETAVTVAIMDDSERPVSAAISQTRSGGAVGPVGIRETVTYVRFCSRTEEPVPVEPGLTVRIYVFEGTCTDGTPSLPSTGKIVADFHRG